MVETDLESAPSISSSIAQLVEQMTVNHWVPGSSPGRGAKFNSLGYF